MSKVLRILALSAMMVDVYATDIPPTPRPESIFSGDYAGLLWRDAKGVATAPADWDTFDWCLAGGVVVGAGTLFAFDHRISAATQENRNPTVDSVTRTWQDLGDLESLAIVGAFTVAGEVFGDPRAEAVAQDAIPAMLFTAATVTGTKFVFGRERPDEGRTTDFDFFSGQSSFPSGHTSNAFALATVVACNYDSPWVKIGAYTLATGVGVSRVYNNKHYASDVFVGAVIGTFIGYTVHRTNGEARGRDRGKSDAHATRWFPWYDGTSYGIACRLNF